MNYFIAGLAARVLSFVPWLLPVGVPAQDWRTMSDYLWGKPVPPERLKEVLTHVKAIL